MNTALSIRDMHQQCDCRYFSLQYDDSLSGVSLSNGMDSIQGSIGKMTQLTGLYCGYCETLPQYTPAVLGLPSLMHLEVVVKYRYPPDAEAVRARYAMLSSQLISLAFHGGMQIMVSPFLLQGCIVGHQTHQWCRPNSNFHAWNVHY